MTFEGNGNGSGGADELLQLRKELLAAQRAKAKEVKRFQQKTKKSRQSKWVLQYVSIEATAELILDEEEDEDEDDEEETHEEATD